MATTFSESWFQIAPLRLGLLPTVRAHKQVYRGRVWYVLQDSCSGKFFRVTEAAYQFIGHLTEQRTIDDIWTSFVDTHPQEAPGQEEVAQLLSQLHHANLLFYRSDSDSQAILQRHQKQTRKEHLSKLMAFMYLRVPLWNPNDLLNASIAWLSPLFSRWAFALWLVVVLWGGKTIVDHWSMLWQQGQGMLAPDNVFLLFLSMFVLKFFHEMAHAITVKRYGGDVHTMGLMFIVLTPLPYVDASASWSLRNRFHRMVVGAAGMYVELFFAAMAAVIWAATAPGLVNSLAFNVMVIGSVSSLLFNGNPLLRFDAYYMLSDGLDLPNLYNKANEQWLYYFDKYLLGTYKADSPSNNTYERFWYTAYAFLSYFYRLFIMIFIAAYAADIWIGFGVIMLVLALFIWVLLPLFKLFKYLLTSGRIRKNRTRAWFTSMGAMLGLIWMVGLLPVPYSLKAPAVVQATHGSSLYLESGGQLVSTHVTSGQTVSKGQVLLTFEHADLAFELQQIQQQLVEVDWHLRYALESSISDLMPIRQRQEALQAQQQELQHRLDQLTLKAPHDGIWIGEELETKKQVQLRRGTLLGKVIDPQQFQVIAVVTQEQALALFDRVIERAPVRLSGQTQHTVMAEPVVLIPFRKTQLPSAALGWQGGGSIMSETDAQGRVMAKEPFFELQAQLPPLDATNPVQYLEGMTAKVRIELPWQPIYWQLQQAFLQLIQKRYQL